MTSIFLSVIIPARNESEYIGHCLSALAISLAHWGGDSEIIVVNNSSTDNTKELTLERGCKIVDAPDCNISLSRNLGAKMAKGSIIAFLDADCIVDEKWVSYCIDDLQDVQVACVGTRAVPDFENATWVEKAWYRLISGAERPEFVDWLGTSNLFVKKKIFNSIGGFNESLKTAEDVDFGYRISKIKLIYLEKRINTIHLRESKTLKELFKREYWRGKSSLKSFFNHNFNLKELASVAIPATNLMAIISFFTLMIMRVNFALIPAMLVLLFPWGFLVTKKLKISPLSEFLGCYIIALIYISARSCSLVHEVYDFLLK